jgi:hypothetical protein
MNVGSMLLAALSQAPGQRRPPVQGATSTSTHRKRKESDSEEDGSAAAARPEKRRRVEPPPPRVQPLVVAASNNNSIVSVDDGDGLTADEDRSKVYMSLDQMGKQAMSTLIDRMMEDPAADHTCFFCTMVERYEAETKRTGGQSDFMIDGAYGYKLAVDFHNNNSHLLPIQRARGMNEIYRVHVYDPAQRALGGAKPPHLPEPSVRAMLEHIIMFNYDPVSLNMEALRVARNMVYSFGSVVGVDGKPNWQTGRTILAANDQFVSLVEKQVKLMDGRVPPTFALDVQKVMAFASTRPLDAFRAQAKGALGGATATNTAEEVQIVTAQRPTFGILESEAEPPSEVAHDAPDAMDIDGDEPRRTPTRDHSVDDEDDIDRLF